MRPQPGTALDGFTRAMTSSRRVVVGLGLGVLTGLNETAKTPR